MSHITCHVSHVACHVSHVMFHMSHVSHVTCVSGILNHIPEISLDKESSRLGRLDTPRHEHNPASLNQTSELVKSLSQLSLGQLPIQASPGGSLPLQGRDPVTWQEASPTVTRQELQPPRNLARTQGQP